MYKPTQYLIGKDDFYHNAASILHHYKVREPDLFRIFDALCVLVKSSGIEIKLINLHGLVEDGEKGVADHAETCTSDGKIIYLHDQLSDHGGILTRIYDVLHMGCGHLIQWGANNESGLKWYGENARAIGSVFHLGADEKKLQEIEEYEFEAGRLGISYLNLLVKDLSLDSDPKNIIQLYNDYVWTDSKYIIDYYKTGLSKNFFSGRLFDQPLIDKYRVPLNHHPKQRTTIQIGLIRSDS